MKHLTHEVGRLKSTDWPKHPSFLRMARSFAKLFLTALEKHKDCEFRACVIQTIKEMKTAKSLPSTRFTSALGEYVSAISPCTRNRPGIVQALIYAGISLVVPLVSKKVESRSADGSEAADAGAAAR